MISRLRHGEENELDPAETIPEIVPDLVVRRSKGRVLFVHPERPRWVLLNESGAELAQLLDGTRTVRAIAETVAAEADVATEIVEADLMALVRDLYRRGFLVTEADRQYRGKPFGVSSVFVRVTDACNLRCTQCYTDSFGALKSKTNEFTTEELRALLREIKDLHGRTVTFSGGEPLLRPDMLDIIEYAANELGMRVKLLSNGTLLLGEGVVQRLVPIVEYLQVSFDGPSAEVHDAVRGRGSFDSSVRGVQAYLEGGGKHSLALSMTLMRENIACAHDLPLLAQRLGVATVRYLTVMNDGRAADGWADVIRPSDEQYIEFYEGLYFARQTVEGVDVQGGLQGFLPQIATDFRDECMLCPVSLTPAVSPTGDVYPCSVFERPHMRVGNVREAGGLRAVIDSGKLQTIRTNLEQRPKEISECSKCDWRGLCQSGCAGSVDMNNGDVRHPDGYCEVRDHLYMRLIFDEAGKGSDAGNCACVD